MLERLKKARKDLGYTQSEFAKELGMTTTSYNYIENGKTPLQEKHIKSICAIFDINETWLRYGMNEEFKNSGITREILKLTNELSSDNQEYLLEIIKAIYEKQIRDFQEIDDPTPPEEG